MRSLQNAWFTALVMAVPCTSCIAVFDEPLHEANTEPSGADRDAGRIDESDAGSSSADAGSNTMPDAGTPDSGIADSGVVRRDGGSIDYDCAGRVIHVSTRGDDGESGESEATALATINQALSRAIAGDCILLWPGDYLQDVRTVRDGAFGAPITVTGPPEAVIRGGGLSRIFEINHDHIHLDGFTIDGLAGADPDLLDSYRKKLIYVVGISIGDPLVGTHIRNMTLRNARDECVRLRYFARGSTVAYNLIENCGLEDFRFGGSGTNGEAVYLGTSASQRLENPTTEVDLTIHNYVHHNTMRNVSECIDLKEGADENRLEYNECSLALDPNSGAFNCRANRNQFHANRIFGNAGAGIRLGGTPETDGTLNGVDNTIVCNFINNNQEGIKFQTTPQADVCGNEMPQNNAGASTGSYGATFRPQDPCNPPCGTK